MQFLQAMEKHGTIFLFQNILADLHDQIPPDAQNIRVVCGMVNLTQGESIGHDRVSARMAIREDVCCLQQLGVPKASHSTTLSIGLQDTSAELLLVHPSLCHHGDVFTAGHRSALGYSGFLWGNCSPVVHLHVE